jgi:hypothetical protein
VSHLSGKVNLAPEPFKSIRLPQNFWFDCLDGQILPKFQVLCLVYFPHSAGSDKTHNPKSPRKYFSWQESML